MQLFRQACAWMALLSGFYAINVMMLVWRILATTQRLTLPVPQVQHQSVGRRRSIQGGDLRRYGDRGCTPYFSRGKFGRNDSGDGGSPPLRLRPRPEPCCLSQPGAIFLLILVTSSPRQFPIRQAIRDTWGGVAATVTGGRVLTRFLLGRGEARQRATQARIEAESERHGDIVQGDFEDVYRNLTLKTIVGFRWAAQDCPSAAYVMKTDSDMYVNVLAIAHYLSNSSLATKLVVGDIAEGDKPVRSLVNKWYVSEEDYPHATYPAYAKGPGYVVSGAVVSLLAQSFRTTPFFVWEDVYVGICLRRLGIAPVAEQRFETYGIRIRTGCEIAGRFVVHGVKYFQLKVYWKLHQDALVSNNCSQL